MPEDTPSAAATGLPRFTQKELQRQFMQIQSLIDAADSVSASEDPNEDLGNLLLMASQRAAAMNNALDCVNGNVLVVEADQ